MAITRYWHIEIKERSPGGGWWGIPIGPAFDPVQAFGLPNSWHGPEMWYNTGTQNIFIIAELREINHDKPNLGDSLQCPDQDVLGP